MMTQAQKDLWLKNLRSGEYKQTTGRLKCLDGYCCLGVFAYTVLNERDANYGGYPSRSMLSADQESHLITMNDFNNNSFSQIANWIEENVRASDGAGQGNGQMASGDQSADGSQPASN